MRKSGIRRYQQEVITKLNNMDCREHSLVVTVDCFVFFCGTKRSSPADYKDAPCCVNTTVPLVFLHIATCLYLCVCLLLPQTVVATATTPRCFGGHPELKLAYSSLCILALKAITERASESRCAPSANGQRVPLVYRRAHIVMNRVANGHGAATFIVFGVVVDDNSGA